MALTRNQEISENYAFFKSVVAGMITAGQTGRFALLRNCAVVDYFDTAGEAVASGTSQFGDMPFSVQCVTNRPIDLGFLSHATDHGLAG